METQLKIGDKVEWFSMGGKELTGKVVRVIGESVRTPRRRIADVEFPGHKRQFDGNNNPGNAPIAYFVEVLSKTGKAKPKLYMPYPSKLRKVG